jgi:peroxiredoxin
LCSAPPRKKLAAKEVAISRPFGARPAAMLRQRLFSVRHEQRNAMKSIITLCLILATATAFTTSPASAQTVAPAWVLPSIHGTNINSTNFAGKVVVLNFWATWCNPCCDEIPSLIALQQKYATNGMTVIGVSLDSSPDGINPPTSVVSSSAASLGINYPVVMDAPLDKADSLYGIIEYGPGGYIEYIPNTFIIDRQNHIAQTFVGEQTYATYESAVLPLIYANLTVNLSVTNGQARISWAATPVTFVVQSTSNLSSGVWTTQTAPVLSAGTNQFIEVPLGPKQQFFRLQSQ